MEADHYLHQERQSPHRSEFVNGHVYAMSGGTAPHSALIAAFASELRTLLAQRPCVVTVSDLRLHIAPHRAYLYPDVMVTCGGFQYADAHQDMIENPTLVLEVLSPSTERYDRTAKFALYRTVPSLNEYVLVSPDEKRVEWYTRNQAGNWEYREASGDQAACHLAHLGVTVELDALYRNIPGLEPLT